MWKKIDPENLPKGEVIAMNTDSECLTGYLYNEENGRVKCEMDEYVLFRVKYYQEIPTIEQLDSLQENIVPYDEENNIVIPDNKDAEQLERFTLAAMQGLCADPQLVENISECSIRIAKETIKQLKEEQQKL